MGPHRYGYPAVQALREPSLPLSPIKIRKKPSNFNAGAPYSLLATNPDTADHTEQSTLTA